MHGIRDGEDAWPPTNPGRASTRIGFDTELFEFTFGPKDSTRILQRLLAGGEDGCARIDDDPEGHSRPDAGLSSTATLWGEPTRDKYLIVDGGAVEGMTN